MKYSYLIFPAFFVLTGFSCSRAVPAENGRAEDMTNNEEEITMADAPNLEGLTTTDSGLQYRDDVVGEGEEAAPGQNVTVHYTGMFTDGNTFDSSVDRDTPFVFKLGAGMVIKGWDEGVAGMKVGGKRLLVVPPELGYGDSPVGPIPAGSTLVFEVELLGVSS